MRRAVRVGALVGVLAAVCVLAGCGADAGSADGGQGGAAGGQAVDGELTVFAAASLTDVFEVLGADLEAANPGLVVSFVFAGSSALAQQILDGAPADVFASASPRNLAQVGELAIDPAVFARNTLQIAVPKGNPGRVTGLADFANPGLRIALCGEQAPCGAAAVTALAAAGVTARPDTLERDVRAALTKVALGEVDAALVYRTDVSAAADDVEGIDFPEASEAANDYPIAVLADAPNRRAAAAFVELVRSERGRAALAEAGFTAP